MRIVRIGLTSLAAPLCVIGLRAEPNPTVTELLIRQQGWQEKLSAAMRSVEADTEDGENKISGLGIFYGCMGADPFQIEGKLENGIIALDCANFSDGPPLPTATWKFKVISHEGGVAWRPIGTDKSLGDHLLVPQVAYSKLNETFLERIRARRERGGGRIKGPHHKTTAAAPVIPAIPATFLADNNPPAGFRPAK